MKCMSCKGGEMKPAATTYFAQLNNSYVIIENVPCLKCEQCGEEFLNTAAAEKIDDILDSIEKIASKIFILDYTAAAACTGMSQTILQYPQLMRKQSD